jgi:predicted DNA-binding WGR domain protein
MAERAPLLSFLDSAHERGGAQTDDVIAAVVPLFTETAALHEKGLVAELEGPQAYLVKEPGVLALARPEGIPPRTNREAIDRLQAPVSSVLRVVGEHRLVNDVDAGVEVSDLAVAQTDAEKKLDKRAWLPGYRAWEHAVEHHDAASDILCLGQVLASLALSLDFTSEEDLRLFAANRHDLFKLNARLHPVLAAVIVEMTELDRLKRTQDLPSVVRRLLTYREQPRQLGLDAALGAEGGVAGKRRAVQTRLRDRLFDVSRRNRLLYFRPTASHVNLTIASVPLVIHLQNIKLSDLCVWGGGFENAVLSGERVSLAQWLRFEDQPYLPGALDHIIQESRRDRAEFGFSQLSLVIAFLRWHNLKEAKDERIVSPLLLLPVDVTRKKGVRDQYLLEAETTEAEVNPVLRHQLAVLYGIQLPESIDLKQTNLAAFHQSLQAQIAATEPAVQLTLSTEPQIELIHQRATQRLEQFRRRQAARAPLVAPVSAADFSYRADDFRPLGLKLFRERVMVEALALRSAVGGAPDVRRPNMAPAREHTTYALRENAGNPYVWDVDLTTVTLGNFNYRKMSLVRDYNALVEADMPNEAFDRVFSLKPRALDQDAPPPLPLPERWAVVTADATQTAAVALARTGTSYIIQGPPGTGKSQTITNLVADFVGRGKRVLFVCEKRAAIDVVFHRLKQQGLDELCCMIHDSQADKKSFVMNLKQTYEHWSASDDGLESIDRKRKVLLKSLATDLEALERFDAAMRAAPEHVGTTVRQLIHRLVTLRAHECELTSVQREALPGFSVWLEQGDIAARLERTLRETVDLDALAKHVFARLSVALIQHDRPLARLVELTDKAEEFIDRAADTLATHWPEAPGLTWSELTQLVAEAKLLEISARRGHIGLLNGSSDVSRELDSASDGLAKLSRTLTAAGGKTTHWRDKLDAADARAALAEAEARERSLFRFLQPAWWRLKKTVEARYDFSRHAARPRIAVVLGDLVAEHAAAEALAEGRTQFTDKFGAADAEGFVRDIRAVREAAAQQRNVAAFHDYLLGARDARACVEKFAALGPVVENAKQVLEELLEGHTTLGIDALGESVRDLRENADILPDLLPLLGELIECHPALQRTLRTVQLPASCIEYAVARENLERVYREERWLPRFDATVLARHTARIAAADKDLLGSNAQAMRAAVRRRFRENAQRSQLAASQLDEAGKLFKKAYSAGRRELEHEFGKSMRYKAIREIASANSGQVVRDMKPVWLMSPLSVSDTLPLAPDLFDVVIFDEASQIPVEEAVPALYRAPQVIIVGDEMQLPPTDFFSSGRDADDDTLEVEDEGERFAVVLDADSLLHQGARNLPATLLAWHYRSRSECLIGYSNAAFYAGNLYTIPDRGLSTHERAEILVEREHAVEDHVAAHTDALLSRAVSFHLVRNAPYVNRRNEGEAAHIASVVRELLKRETGKSIGIVAFSEAQQTQIESALNALGADDTDFATRLEAEMGREEDGQYVGLFVKNLENVQGDERDIIILSICYGPGPDGRMLMNFGPINQRGGEKRLNVIFSRARLHMAVVSSIHSDAITNDNNTGAAALKHFLRYAEHLSRGRNQAAQQVLQGLNPLTRSALALGDTTDAIVSQLAAALRARGHSVDEQIGQSRFRCELGIRDDASGHYALGILVDTEGHYANRDVFERFVSRPRILGSFGWNVVRVLSRDWLHDSEGVIARIERQLRADPGAAEEVVALEAAEEPAAPPAPSAPLASAASEDEADEELTTPEEPPAPRPGTAAPVAASKFRRFEFIEGGSKKFWQIGRAGGDVTVNYGRIGTKGQTQIKQYESEERAERELQKLVGEKLRKGYAEV